MRVLRESWGPSPHFYRQLPGLLVLPTSNDWSISAAPAAARAALRAKLQRMALSLRTMHTARPKAIGVRGGVGGIFFNDFLTFHLFIFSLGLSGGENGPGRGLKSWCRDCWYCFYRQMLVLLESVWQSALAPTSVGRRRTTYEKSNKKTSKSPRSASLLRRCWACGQRRSESTTVRALRAVQCLGANGGCLSIPALGPTVRARGRAGHASRRRARTRSRRGGMPSSALALPPEWPRC